MLLVVGGIKGGSGKTTISINLAVCRAKLGNKVLLVDADEQLSSRDWADIRFDNFGIRNEHLIVFPMFGKEIFETLRKSKDDFDDIIIDTGGRDTTSQRASLAGCDAFLAPFRPRSIDIWTLPPLKQLNAEIASVNQSFRVMAVLSQCEPRGNDKAMVRGIIEDNGIECLRVELGYRKAFSDAASQGLGVIELQGADCKSVEEILALHDDIYQGNMLQIYKNNGKHI